MPADIRSFFGGKGGRTSSQETPSSKSDNKIPTPKPKGRGKRKILSDSEEDVDPLPDRSAPKKPTSKKKKESPKGKETTTSDYFGSKGKPSRSTPKKPRPTAMPKEHPAIRKEFTPKTPEPDICSRTTPNAGTKAKVEPAPSSSRSTRTSARTTKNKSYAQPLESDDEAQALPIEDDKDDDIYRADYKTSAKNALDDYESDNDEDELLPSRQKSQLHGQSRKRKSIELSDDEDATSAKARKGKGTTSTPSNSTTVKRPRSSKKKKEEETPEDADVQNIFDSIPTIRPPTPPTRDASKKFDFTTNKLRSQPAPNAGTREIPEGAENCLTGLSFVFTGLLDALGREEGQDLVKRYGGKVTTAPSSKTSYVVLGADAGPKKLETIAKFNLKAINEDGLFDLIRNLPANGGRGKAAVKAEEKKKAEERKVEEAAEQMEEELAARMKAQKKTVAETAKGHPSLNKKTQMDDELWTVKYAPRQMNQICGNKSQVERLQTWLKNWQKNAKANFKKGGPDGSGLYRAVMIHGSPGIGKTTAAHLAAKLEGYDIVESNASDTRSKKLIETGLKGVLDTTSLLGYFAGGGEKVHPGKRRLVLIMDEVDGMSAGDRGGVGAMASVCKKTSIPIILICNERKLPKMKPFDHVTFDVPFRKPTIDQVRSRIMTILFREGMKETMPVNVVNALIEGAGSDIRRIINMMSAAKVDQQAMDFADGKRMTNAWEKHVILKPWDITQKILAGGLFVPSSKATLNDKAELYFNDHDFSPLMLQENYLFPNPLLAHEYQGKEKNLKVLDLVEKAAESISDGDLVDSMIHGSQQHWSLMPTHAILSFVRPASFVSGSTAGNRLQFTSWLGNNSTGARLARSIKEIQGHMRLRASGDRHEIRQQYLPVLWARLIKALELYGDKPHGIQDVIELMDSYFLTKDDWDAIMELGLGPQQAENVKLSTQIKSNFTRKYNAASHPLPFIKAGGAVPSMAKPKERPDLEEAMDDSDGEDVLVDVVAKEEEEDDEKPDLKKDKYIQAPKKKRLPSKAAKKVKSEEAEASLSDGPEPIPKKGTSKAKTTTTARSKRKK